MLTNHWGMLTCMLFPCLQTFVLLCVSNVRLRYLDMPRMKMRYVASIIFLFFPRCWVGASSRWCRSISSFCHRHCRRSSLWLSPAWQRLLLRPRSVAPTPAPRAPILGHSRSWRMPPAHGKVQLRYAATWCPRIIQGRGLKKSEIYLYEQLNGLTFLRRHVVSMLCSLSLKTPTHVK